MATSKIQKAAQPVSVHYLLNTVTVKYNFSLTKASVELFYGPESEQSIFGIVESKNDEFRN